MQKEYEKFYYKNYDIGSKTVSYLESTELRDFFASVAREVTDRFHPQTVLDAGCAMGVLVSEFIKQGVNAYGLDFSQYAITNADSLASKNCFQGSLTKPFPENLPKRFDLVICVGVLECMSPEDGRRAIANLCKVTDTVIFCSSPDDFGDKTRVNVQEREYWAVLFAENGFYDDLNCRPLYITDYAVCYRRRADLQGQISDYERLLREMDRADKDERFLNSERERTRLAKENACLSREKAALEKTYGEMKDEFALAVFQRNDIANSWSWRAMAPVRGIKRVIKQLVGKTARGLFRLAKELRNGIRLLCRKKQALPAASWPPEVEAVVEATGACAVPLHCRRIGIYAFYDADGIVDEYVLYYLKALLPWVDRLLVVCNGQLGAEGEAALRALNCEILVRENCGFDAWGVKAAIEKIGYEALSRYDEAVISNDTFFGPVYGFDGVFSQMAEQEVDFWGISQDSEHIQSYFYCVRGRMLAGEAFRKFWTDLPPLPDCDAMANLYETAMTRFFSSAGYRWGCLMKREAYSDLTDNPLIAMPMEAIRDWKCPFFRRRAFFQDYLYLLSETGHQSASDLLRYIREETNYPVELVWRNLLRTCHMYDLTRNLHLSRILSKDDCFLPAAEPMPRAALFMHIYDHTMAPELAGYAANLPPEVDIYISTVSEEKKDAISRAFRELPNSLEIRVLPNRGRDVSALLTSFRDVVMNYEVACVTHDKRTEFLEPKTVGEGFAYMGYENILGSRAFVIRILREFLRDPFLGLLCSPDPSHGTLCGHIGMEWLGNYQNVKKLAEELGLRVPMDEAYPPVAPYGSSFWFRTAAMMPLFQKAWTYDDFPAEPLAEKDGTIMHAIERIYPYVVQQSGYYSAVVMTTDYAAVEIGNLSYYTSQYSHVAYETVLWPGFQFIKGAYEAHVRQKQLAAEEAAAEEKGGIVRKVRRKLKVWSEL